MYSPPVAGADIIVVRDAHWAIVPALLQVAAQGARNAKPQPICTQPQPDNNAPPQEDDRLFISQLSLVIISRLSLISRLSDERKLSDELAVIGSINSHSCR